MPTRLLNHTLDNLTAGVTQQYEEGAYESQVREMVNCMPAIARGVLRRNPLKETKLLYADYHNTVIYSPTVDTYVYFYDRGTNDELYAVFIDNTFLRVYNLTDTLYTPRYIVATAGTYLEIKDGTPPKDAFDAVTVGDHTFIVNKTITPTMDNDTGNVSDPVLWEQRAFYWIKKTTGVVVKQMTDTNNDTGTRLEGYKYTLNGTTVQGIKQTAPLSPEINELTADEIAAKLANDLGSDYRAEGAFVIRENVIPQWEWEDSFGNEASLGVWKEVDDASKLPAQLPSSLDGFIVRVSGGTSAKTDDYFLKYSATKETWEEIKAPYATYKYDELTMPHVLYRLANASFTLSDYREVSDDGLTLLDSAWAHRESGDEETNEDPSFIGKPIVRIFFHKNRLGFLTDTNIILSSTGYYGNFFSQTVQDVLDDDPIDLAVATTNVTILRDVADTSGSLLLFSDDAQFQLISATGGTLTPISADIIAVSRYNFNKDVPVRAIGNKVYFTSKSGGYNQLFSYKVSDRGAQVTEATPLTLHIPSYLPSTLFKLEGHSVLGYSFMLDNIDRKTLYVLTNTSAGSKDIQNAFHKWTFPYDIASIGIVNNNLYIAFTTGELGYIELEIPGSIQDVVYQDSFYHPQNFHSYFSLLQFYWRDGRGKGSARGRLQLRTLQFTYDEYSHYMTTIFNKSLKEIKPDNALGAYWIDTDSWDDTYVWYDVNPLYARIYKDDDKITVMGDTRYLEILISENIDYPTKGFEIPTINAELLFHQRSLRT